MTDFFLDGGRVEGGSSSRAKDARKQKLLRQTRKQWDSLGLPPIFVNVTWIHGATIAKADMNELSSLLVDMVRPLAEAKFVGIFEPPPSRRPIEQKISWVDLHKIVGVSASEWHSTWGGAVPNLESAWVRLKKLWRQKAPWRQSIANTAMRSGW
ncbi:MAG: hypothetical protein R2862_03470 [Thermoanaerobaculia bacterium]